MIQFLYSDMAVWLFITAVLFTLVGWFFGTKNQMQKIIELTIDSLIKDGYLKTKGTGKDMKVLKWREWNHDKTD